MRRYFIIFVLLISANLFAQIDRSQYNPNYVPLPLKKVVPKVYAAEPYGLDVVVSVGAFDNYKVTTTPGFAETHIAVNPRNPLNFIAGDNKSVISSSNVYVTTNGGVTWSNITTSISQGDPVFAFDSLGNAYYTVLNNGVRVWRSTNGGLNWTNLGNAFTNSSADKQWVECDQTAGLYSNYVYLTYTDFSVTPSAIRFYRSTNNGTSWSSPIQLSNSNSQGSNIAVGPDGRVVVCWSQGGAASKYSTDGGATFSSQVQAASYTEPGVYNSTFGRYVVKGDIRVNGFPQIACDLSNGPYRGRYYINYSANPLGPDNADIFVVKSTDKGVTWNTLSPVRVNDDATTNDQWMSDISVDNQGRVWVFWYDSRNDGANNLTEAYGAVSTDGGETFQNFKISNQSFNPGSVKQSQGSGQAYYIGDYHSIAGKTITMPFWMDGRSNTLDDYSAYLPDYGISFSKPADSINVNGSRQNRLRAPAMGPMAGPINFTATVLNPPGSGTLTVSLSNGGVINNFPDSLIINQSTSNVPAGTYNIQITGTEPGGVRNHTRTYQLVVSPLVGISNNENTIPAKYSLEQNYPNPFNPATRINYSIEKNGFVKLTVFDVTGREVKILVSGNVNAGSHSVEFDASKLNSGLYFYKLESGEYSEVRKMILIK
ncbi:MAG: T9SS type A sorting domain-containing protein [Ignavibacteria bacterium]|nr:T9SS type A sorting domain-containing protein [Ignavibacteria bacterium]